MPRAPGTPGDPRPWNFRAERDAGGLGRTLTVVSTTRRVAKLSMDLLLLTASRSYCMWVLYIDVYIHIVIFI